MRWGCGRRGGRGGVVSRTAHHLFTIIQRPFFFSRSRACHLCLGSRRRHGLHVGGWGRVVRGGLAQDAQQAPAPAGMGAKPSPSNHHVDRDRVHTGHGGMADTQHSTQAMRKHQSYRCRRLATLAATNVHPPSRQALPTHRHSQSPCPTPSSTPSVADAHARLAHSVLHRIRCAGVALPLRGG